MGSRRKFLENLAPRIRFVFLPKHSSWWNQIETVFGIVMRPGNFTSVADLEAKLRRFLEYFHRVFAHPFRWKYAGNPLTPAPPAFDLPPHLRATKPISEFNRLAAWRSNNGEVSD